MSDKINPLNKIAALRKRIQAEKCTSLALGSHIKITVSFSSSSQSTTLDSRMIENDKFDRNLPS